MLFFRILCKWNDKSILCISASSDVFLVCRYFSCIRLISSRGVKVALFSSFCLSWSFYRFVCCCIRNELPFYALKTGWAASRVDAFVGFPISMPRLFLCIRIELRNLYESNKILLWIFKKYFDSMILFICIWI